MNLLRAFLRDERGATSIEYCMIGGLISIIIVVSAGSIGTTLKTMFIGPVGDALQ